MAIMKVFQRNNYLNNYCKFVADDEEDVLLSLFSNEIDAWVIEKLQAIGCDTAKSVLALSAEDIAKRADLEDETVEEVLEILRSEFEDEE